MAADGSLGFWDFTREKLPKVRAMMGHYVHHVVGGRCG